MLVLALPMIGTQLAQMAMGFTDVLMLGWLGPEALAASALGLTLYYMVFTLAMGPTLAISPVVAQAFGRSRHDRRTARRAVTMGLWLVALMMVPAWPLLWFAEDLLLAIGQNPKLAAMSGEYVRALMWGLPFALSFIVLRGFISALDRPEPALWVTVGAIALNAVLNYGLIWGHFGLPALGLSGAGLATTIGSIVQVVVLAVWVVRDRQFRTYRVFARIAQIDLRMMRELARIGAPIGVTLAFEGGLFFVASFAMGYFGTAQLAGHQIAVNVASITFMVPLGLSMAATVRVGQFQGAGDHDGLRRAGWVAIIMAAAFMTVAAIAIWFAPQAIVGLYLARTPENAAAFDAAMVLLALAAAFQLGDGVQVAAAGALRGLKDTNGPMWIAATAYWAIALPVALGLAFWAGWEGRGLWTGFIVGLSLAAVMMSARFWWKTR